MEGTIKVLLEMEDWMGCSDPIMMHLHNFGVILEMNFCAKAEVCILTYLGTLAFVEKGTPCTLMAVQEENACEMGNLASKEPQPGVAWRPMIEQIQVTKMTCSSLSQQGGRLFGGGWVC